VAGGGDRLAKMNYRKKVCPGFSFVNNMSALYSCEIKKNKTARERDIKS